MKALILGASLLLCSCDAGGLIIVETKDGGEEAECEQDAGMPNLGSDAAAEPCE